MKLRPLELAVLFGLLAGVTQLVFSDVLSQLPLAYLPLPFLIWAALREAEERYRMVVELSPDAILVQQDNSFVFGNPAAFTLLGANDARAVLGQPVQQFFGEESLATIEGKLACLRTTATSVRVEEKLRRVEGTTIDVELHAAPFTHAGKTAALLILRDVTERKRTLEQITHLAHFDSLTGLANRTLFRQRLEHALQLSARPGHSVEVLFLDLDHFKNINDTLGHAVGDKVLQEAARRLQRILRESDTVARLGGDEFVVLAENANEPYRGSVIAEKILAAFAPQFLAGPHLLSITTSIGIASFPRDGSDAETLLKHADIAMYQAKESGRNHYQRFSQRPGQQASVHLSRQTELEADLVSAIANDQLKLVYQPRMDVPNNRITGMEALLRWQHPVLGLLPPERFLPLAENTGLIRQIGEWTLRRACTQNKAWQNSGHPQAVIAVNLSARQLEDEHLTSNVAAILQETGLAPAFLELEVAESTVMANPERAMLALGALRDLGVGVTIDHFGIGYSSFTYLRQFPARAIKIDRSFLQGIPANHDHLAITRAIIDFAHGLGVSVIAQGAETRQQVEFLREHNCDSVQGFYFSEPVSADMLGGLLRAPEDLPLH